MFFFQVGGNVVFWGVFFSSRHFLGYTMLKFARSFWYSYLVVVYNIFFKRELVCSAAFQLMHFSIITAQQVLDMFSSMAERFSVVFLMMGHLFFFLHSLLSILVQKEPIETVLFFFFSLHHSCMCCFFFLWERIVQCGYDFVLLFLLVWTNV